jgi:predicted metal-dependent peptidase
MSLTIAQEKQAHRLSVAKSECYGFSIASAAILAPVPIVIDDRQPTACTDGKKIYFSSVFAEKLNPLELAGTIIHEALHIMLMHSLRMLMLMERGFTAHEINVAADYIINGKIKRMKGYGSSFLLPEGALFHDVFSSSDEYSLEYVCEELRKNPPPQPQGQPQPQNGGEGGQEGGTDPSEPQEGQGQGQQDENAPPVSAGTGPGDIIPMPDVDATDPRQVQEAVNEIRDRITRAQIAEKATGSGSVSGVTTVDNSDLVSKTVPLQTIKKFIRDHVKSGRTWKRPNRRFVSQKIYMPARDRKPNKLYCCVDTSGSVGMFESQQFRDNLVSWSALGGIDKLMMSYVDSVLHKNKDTPWFEVTTNCGRDAKDMVLEFYGGGGTSFDPIFEHIADSNEQIPGLIYFTDGYGRVSAPKPPFPVLWVTTHVAPTFVNQKQWGEVVYI